MSRHWVAAIGIACAGLLTAGCESVVTTVVQASDSQATVTVQAAFTGEVAQAISGDQEMVDQLAETFTTVSGQRPTIDLSPTEVTAHVSVPADQVSRYAQFTGVGSLGAAPEGGVVVAFTEPSRLIKAVDDVAQTRTDGRAFADAAAANTYVQVSVEFTDFSPGEVRGSTPWQSQLEGERIVFRQSLQGPFDGQVSVFPGVATSTAGIPVPLIIGAAGAGLLLLGGVVAVRRRNARVT